MAAFCCESNGITRRQREVSESATELTCYRHTNTSPRCIAVDLERQLLPCTFEHALDHLIDHELALTGFDARYRS